MAPQHDGTIANASGSAVRADLNNALAALITNSSGATSPATTYAFQFWADTTTGQLKIRNAGNSAWITLMELDGTLLLENGSAGSPSIAFRDDLDTGFFKPAGNTLAISAGGTARARFSTAGSVFNEGSHDVDFRVESNGDANMLFVDGGNDRVGIATNSPDAKLHVAGVARIGANDTSSATLEIGAGATGNRNAILDLVGDTTYTDYGLRIIRTNTGANAVSLIEHRGTGAFGIKTVDAAAFALSTSNTERFRVTSAGEVGINVSNPGSFNAKAETLVLANGGDDVGITLDCDTDKEGSIYFADGGSGDNLRRGQIVYNHDGDSLRFVTNASERLRIDSSGRLLLGITSARANFFNSTDAPQLQLEATSFVGSAISCVRNVNSAAAGGLVLGKSRGTAVGSNTVVQSGDSLGQISFQGADGSEMVEAAKITAVVDTTPGANDMPCRLAFAVTSDGNSTTTERLRINSGGRTNLFGTTEALRVRTALATDSTTVAIRLQAAATDMSTGGNTRYQVLANGNVQNASNSYGAISDQKLKENIVNANSQWDDLKAIQVRNYNFIEGQTHTQIGVVAQEVETVSPGLVSESPDIDDEGNDLGTVTKSVNYSVLYMKAVKALQEAMDRIETLEAKVAALEAQ